MVKQPRIHDDYESFRRKVVDTFTIEDVLNEIRVLKEIHYVSEFYRELCEYEAMADVAEDVEAMALLNFISDFDKNIYDNLYDYYMSYFDCIPAQAIEFSEVVDLWIQDNQNDAMS